MWRRVQVMLASGSLPIMHAEHADVLVIQTPMHSIVISCNLPPLSWPFDVIHPCSDCTMSLAADTLQLSTAHLLM